MGVNNSSNNKQPVKKSGGTPSSLLSKPPLLLTAGHTVVNAVKPAVQAVASTTKTAANKVVEMHDKTHPKRRWVFWLVGALIVIGLGAGAYWLFFGPKPSRTLTATSLPVSPFLRTADLVSRNSTIPVGAITRSGNTLFPEINSSFTLPLGQMLAIRYFHQAEDGSTSDTSVTDQFSIDANGDFHDANGQVVDGLQASGLSSANKIELLLVASEGSHTPGILLSGSLPSSGRAQLQFPFDLKNVLGRVVTSYSEDLKKYSIGIELTGLPDVSDHGWKYTAWLAQMDGPYIKRMKNLGSFFPAGSGKANHEFSSADALAAYDTVVVSLEPADDGDQLMSPVRLFSATVDLR